MKVLIIGGGAVGSVLCNLLAKEKDIEIICGDMKERVFKNEKIKFLKIDISNKLEFSELLKNSGVNFVVNAATSWLNIPIMEACYENNINYMDMSSMWEHDPDKNAKSPYKVEQLDFNERFKEKNIFGLINAGVAPGMDNLLSRECADELDIVETIKIRLVDYSGSKKMYFSWSKEVLLEELASKPLIFENWKFKQVDAFSGQEDFKFPMPFGIKKVNLICQEEIGTIPLYIKVKNIDEKDYDDQVQKQKFLYDLGLLSKEKIKIGQCEVSPLELTCKILPDVLSKEELKKFKKAQFAMLVQAEGYKKKKRKTIRFWAVFPAQEQIDRMNLDANFITYPTALSAAFFVLALPYIQEKGVFPPEALDKNVRKIIIDKLKKHCLFKKEIKKR